MKVTPRSTACRSTRMDSSWSRGGPQTPGPGSCMVPKPSRLIVVVAPRSKVSGGAAVEVLTLSSSRAPVLAGLRERDLAHIDRDDERLGERLAVWRSRKDLVLGGDHDAGHLRVVGDVVRGAGAAHDLDVVVMAPDQAVVTDVQCLLGAVRGKVARPLHAQPAPVLAVLLPWAKLSGFESRQGEGEGLREVGPHRVAGEVGQLKRRPRC